MKKGFRKILNFDTIICIFACIAVFAVGGLLIKAIAANFFSYSMSFHTGVKGFILPFAIIIYLRSKIRKNN